ncbi:hypothetical protein DMH04_45840 [Kibdelosporangium aridum]|uniref:Uncharacterized protein n=1 Tax=Kibdelosporangium aridum TaxID=2030 RepID=A0A428YN82_KIBAR|nr:hypothetical protein [Kibdelosporangium aridum]RSM69647.1 hypothetical protein DMH04_45840 [Kibdelosporangium aridum]
MLAAMAVACATTAVAIAVNFATDLKTNVFAWIAVPLATLLSGVVAEAAQRVVRGEPIRPLFARPGGRRVAIAISALTLAAMIVSVTVVLTVSTNAGDVAEGDTRPAVQQEVGYQLISSSGFCPKTDKLDLDTAQPGRGGQPQLGDLFDQCKMDGGLAELVLEPDEIHTPNGSRQLFLLNHGESAGYRRCLAALTERLTDRISLRDIRQGSHICVRTDVGNVAQVGVVKVDRSTGSETHVVIDFSVWSP